MTQVWIKRRGDEEGVERERERGYKSDKVTYQSSILLKKNNKSSMTHKASHVKHYL